MRLTKRSALLSSFMSHFAFDAAWRSAPQKPAPIFDPDGGTPNLGSGSGSAEPNPKKGRVKRDAASRKKAAIEKMNGAGEDTRDDKYLHSHARQMRRLRWAMSYKGLGYPFDPDGRYR